MERLALRSVYLTILSNQNLTKSIAPLSKITHLQFSNSPFRDKKLKCIKCGYTFESIIMLLLHLQLIHYNILEVKEYEINGDTIFIDCRDVRENTSILQKTYIHKNQNSKSKKPQFYLKQNITMRCKGIINHIISKIQRVQDRKQNIFFRSNDIFTKINSENMSEDSEEDVGEIEVQLERIKIQDFSDVNQNDKSVFIKWNEFKHESEKKLKIVYDHDIPRLFVEFARNAPANKLNRINLIMHAWALWSVGQLKAQDFIKGLQQYDKYNQMINDT